MKKEDYKKFKDLIGGIIDKASIIIFPPLYEESLYYADISINLTFNNGKSYTFTTDENLWSCLIKEEKVESKFKYSDFKDRTKFWMNDETAEEYPIVVESYEICLDDELGFLLGCKLLKIDYMYIDDSEEFNPHGIILTFNNEVSCVSTCGHDGNTIQTKGFLEGINLMNRFKDIGETILIKIHDL